MIVKRDGRRENLNVDKIHFVVDEACNGLSGVSASQIEMNANLQFYNGMTTTEIQNILIRSASDLISLEAPNYQYAAARLLLYGLYKQVFGDYKTITLQEMIEQNIARNVYDSAILDSYSDVELKRLNSFINHKRDENFTYAGLQQVVDKYLCQDRSTGEIFETPQYMYMMIAATIFANYPKETRLEYVRKYYDAISLFKVNIPTPIMGGVRTPLRQFASCVLVDVDDSLDSIFSSDMAICYYTAQRAGIGINVGRIRGINSKIRGGEVAHTGIIPFLKKFESTVRSTTQNGIRGGCFEKDTLIEIKTNIINTNSTKIYIQDAVPGIFVKSYNVETQETEYREILNTFLPIVENDDQHRLIYEDGGYTVTSGKHRNLLIRDGNEVYVAAKDTVVGDMIVSDNGTTRIVDIQVGSQSNSEQFYDIEVEHNNNFYAQGNNNVTNMYVAHNSASVYIPIWHQEIEDVMVLKNNKGTEDNRVRKLDYGIQLNKTMYERLLSGGNITLFSPHEVPGLYDAYYGDPDEFKTLYEKYEKDNSIKKKSVSAMDLFTEMLKERAETGRIYIMNVDHANTHSSFKDRVHMSNLCLSGDSLVQVIVDKEEKTISLVELDNYFKLNKHIEILSFDLDNNKKEYKKVSNSAQTSASANVMKITDDKTGKFIICTPEHKVYTQNRGYVMAKDLKDTDNLLVN